MKKDFSNLCFSLAGLATIAVPQTVQADESLPYWKDIQVVSVNREEPRSAFMTYANKTQALTGDYEKSPYYQLLNGTWKFYYTDSYKQLPADVTEASPSEQGWQNITVPGNWEVQGFGTAIYTNHGYEFQPLNPKPPQLPENTPVGVYRLPKHLDEEVARLHLDNLGVELTRLSQRQADYIGVDVDGPYKAEHYRY